MNEQLKFSWGHIIAFLALIVLSYITFVGVTYKTDGDFTIAAFSMLIVVFTLFVFFIGAQIMKASTKKFAKRIWIERILVCTSPFVFVVCSIPYFHFGSVQSHDKEIVNCFVDAISASKQMFVDYEEYSFERIANYDKGLNLLIASKDKRPNDFASSWLKTGEEKIQKKNMVEALRLQLISENYDSLKASATKWIESSSRGASTWNVFLLGNTKEIKKAIHDWNGQLIEFSSHKMVNENLNGLNKVETFDKTDGSLNSVDNQLNSLRTIYTQSSFPPISYIIVSIIIYFALLFPYILQDRHTKSQYRLFGMERGASRNASTIIDTTKQSGNVKIGTKENESLASNLSNPDDKDDYASFTM